MKRIKQTIGALMILSFFGGIFAMEVHYRGWIESLKVFGLVLGMFLFIVVAIDLMAE